MTPTRSTRLVACAALACVILSCGGGSSKSSSSSTGTSTPEEMQLAVGVENLQTGDYTAAQSAFDGLAADPAVGCRARYGRSIAVAQQTVAELDMLSDAAGVLVGGILGSVPWTVIDVLFPSEDLLQRFEASFEEAAQDLDFVIAHDCTLMVPKGVPFEVGTDSTPIHVVVRFGYEFDAAAARAARVAFGGALAGVRIALAHELGIDELQQLLDPVQAALRDGLHVDIIGPGQASQQTIVEVLRKLAAVVERDPKFLTLRSPERVELARKDIYAAVRAFYSADGDAQSGLTRQLEMEAAADDNPRDDALALDDVNGDGHLDAGDTLIVGVRELRIDGVFGSESIANGLGIRLTDDLGDIAAMVRAAHETAQIIGDQMADDVAMPHPRLGLQQVNDVIRAVAIPGFQVETMPEAVELDLRGFFVNPKGARDFLPYRIDDDGNPLTPPVFLVEGESWGTSPAEEYVKFGDSPHFQGTYSAALDGAGRPTALSGLAIEADGVSPPLLSIVAPFPLPYAAYQDPTFNQVLYVDLSALPADLGREGDSGFVPADVYGANKVIAAYGAIILRQGLVTERGLFGGRPLFGAGGLLRDERLFVDPGR